MSQPEQFDLKVGDGIVTGVVLAADGTDRAPAVLICGDLSDGEIAPPRLVADLADALGAGGMTVVRFNRRRDDAAARASAAALVDDATTVFEWLLEREDVDAGRLGVVGIGFGTIIASCLAGRTSDINRLCLVAPLSATALATRHAGDGNNTGSAAPNARDLAPSFVESLTTLSPVEDVVVHGRTTLIVSGAADRHVSPDLALPYVNALELTDHAVTHELVAHGDHELAALEIRAVCLSRIEHFFTEMTSPAVAS